MKIREIIIRLRDQGKTIFFSSHELSEVELVCNRLAILARGKTVTSGRISDIVPPGKSLEKYFLEATADRDNA